MKNRVWLVVGAVLGLLAVAFVQGYLKREEAKLREKFRRAQGKSVKVLIAASDIPEQTQVDAKMVAVKMKPEESLQPHALVDPDQAVGKIALVPIYAGEQIQDSKLGTRERANTLSMKTPPGKRAITMPVDAVSAVGGFIRPGDFVDIIGIFTIPGPEGGKGAPVTVMLLQKVLTLATGGSFSEFQGGKEGGQARESNTLTLALTPQEAELLLFARTQGSLQYALRPKADSVILTDLPLMTGEALLSTILGPKIMASMKPAPELPPAPTPEPPRQVEVYRALEKEVVVLPQ